MHKCVKVSVVYLGGIQDSSKGGAVIMHYYIYIYIHIYVYNNLETGCSDLYDVIY